MTNPHAQNDKKTLSSNKHHILSLFLVHSLQILILSLTVLLTPSKNDLPPCTGKPTGTGLKRPSDFSPCSCPHLLCSRICIPTITHSVPSSLEASNCGGSEGTLTQLICGVCPQGFSATPLGIHKSFIDLFLIYTRSWQRGRKGWKWRPLTLQWTGAAAVPATPSKSWLIFQISRGQLVIQRPQSRWWGTERGFCFPQKGKLRFLWWKRRMWNQPRNGLFTAWPSPNPQRYWNWDSSLSWVMGSHGPGGLRKENTTSPGGKALGDKDVIHRWKYIAPWLYRGETGLKPGLPRLNRAKRASQRPEWLSLLGLVIWAHHSWLFHWHPQLPN